ncbi:MAG TPA: metallophosphoesterase family protein [Trebonia sp.]|nr:metallophosphoesterase family protein [Trebonia sp.]
MGSYMTPEQAKKLSLAEQNEWFRRATSRRNLLRGGIAVGAVAAGSALLGGTADAATTSASTLLHAPTGPSGGSTVVPFGQHIAYGADPTSQMAIAWQVRNPVSQPYLRISDSPAGWGEKIQAEVRTLATPKGDISPIDSVPLVSPATIEQYYLHVTVDHLRPGQTYYYTVGHDGYEGHPVAGSFTTAPSGRQPFRFTAFGDEGVSYDAVATSNLVKGLNPAFHLHAGDISYAEDTGHGLITDGFDPRVWDGWFTEAANAAGSIPWQVATGNHEMEAWYTPDGYGGHHARWDIPGGTSAPVYYSFTYGNVGVVSLDANDVSYEIPANLGYSGGKQAAWLNTTLAALRADKDIDFIVAYFHHCAYSTCTSHASEGGARQYFAPLFDKYGVDLVINGHNHIYERNNPLIGGKQTVSAPSGSTVTPATQGTTYIVAGGAGDSLYSFNVADSYEGNVDNVASISSYVNVSGAQQAESVSYSQVRYTGYGLVVVDSAPASHGGTSTLLVRGLNEDGVEIDRVTLARKVK